MPKHKICDKCDSNLSEVHSNNNGYHYFYCSTCRKKYSLRNGTILSMAHVTFRKFVLLVYTFISCIWTYKQVKTEVSISSSEDRSDDDESDNDRERSAG